MGRNSGGSSGLKKENTALRKRLALMQAADDDHRRQLQGLRAAVETMQLGVTLKDIQGRILYSNPAEARMHGYESEELRGRPGRVLGSPENYRKMSAAQ